MQLTVDRSILAEILVRGSASAARLATIPILSHVRLTARDGVLRATSNDMRTQTSAAADVDIAEEGDVTVEANAIKLFVDRLPPAAKIKMVEEPNRLVVSSGRMRARLATLPPADMPTIDLMQNEHQATNFDLKGSDLATLFGRTVPAVSKEATRFYLGGVFLHHSGSDLRGVATNGHVLLMSSIEAPVGAEAMPEESPGGRRGTIIATETATTALRLFGRAEAVNVTVTSRGVIFEDSSTTYMATSVDGRYPDHDRVIPSVSENLISLDRAACTSAVSVIEVFQERDDGHILECAPDGDGLAMAAGSGAEGDGFAVTQAEFVGDIPVFGISSKYLRTAVAAFTSETVKLSIGGHGAPIRFFSERDPTTVAVVMPMRVRSNSAIREARP